jgi:hypothetical protein
MTTFGDKLYELGGVPVGSAIGTIGLAGGNVYFVDVANGVAGNNARTPATATNSVSVAYGYCTDGNNDTVVLIGSGSAWAPTATLTWAKSYTHLVGACSALPGMGSRARIEAGTAADLTSVITVSGTGCLFANLKITNLGDADTDQGTLLVSGGRNAFINVMVGGMGHATPAARAGSYSVKVTGEENYFERCTIGLTTIVRAAANAELWITGIRTRVVDCDIRSNSVTAGKFLVKIDNTAGDMRDTIFQDVLFYNYATNWAAKIDNAFDMPTAGATHDVILRGNCQFVGCTGVADVVTRIQGCGPAPNAGMFLSTAPTT